MQINKILLALLCLSLNCYSQGFKSSIALTGGYTQDGYAVLGTYNHYINYEDDFIQGSVFAGFIKQKFNDQINIPYNIFTFNYGYFKNVITNRSMSFKLSLGGGGVIGYEGINKGDRKLENGSVIISDSKLIYGAFLGVDSDFFISENISAIVKINQYYHANSDVGGFTIFAGAGVRYLIQ